MGYQLLTRLRVLSFGEPGELLRADRTGEAEVFGQTAVPFALNGVALFPIVLPGGGEFFGMVGLCLAGGEWFRDIQHDGSLSLKCESLLVAGVVGDGCFARSPAQPQARFVAAAVLPEERELRLRASSAGETAVSDKVFGAYGNLSSGRSRSSKGLATSGISKYGKEKYVTKF